MANSHSGAQTPKRARGSSKCPHHYGKEVVYICESCNDLACGDCVSKVHKGHDLDGLADHIPEVKQKLRDFLSVAETSEMPGMRDRLRAVDDDLAKNKRHFQVQIRKIETQNEDLKKELDIIAKNFVKSCRNMEQEREGVLYNQKQELQARIDKLNSQIQECRNIIYSENDVLMFDVLNTITSTFDDLTPVIKPTEFIPGKIVLPELEQFIGEFSDTKFRNSMCELSDCTIGNAVDECADTNTGHVNGKMLDPNTGYATGELSDTKMGHVTSEISEISENNIILEQCHNTLQDELTDVGLQSKTNSNYQSCQLLPNNQPKLANPPKSNDWRVTSQFTPSKGLNVTTMRAAPGGQVWVCFRPEKKMILADQKGQVHHSLDLDTQVYQFCLCPNTDNIWFCSHDNSVRQVQEGRPLVMFEPDRWPASICITVDDHVVLGHESQIVKYTKNGQVVLETSKGGLFGTPEVRFPQFISGCPLTKRLAVVDMDRKNCGGKGEPFVSILNDDLTRLYIYSGDRQVQQPYSREFHPCDVCFATTGELLLSDWGNRSVILLNQKAEYLQTVYTHNELKPEAVCVLNDKSIFVSFNNNNVRVLKYKNSPLSTV